jgi:xylan 1,4-beta-xylosidase
MNPKNLLVLAALTLSSFGEVTYENPVIPGDYPDPSVVRVGNDYYATATTSEWAPLFPILHSRDLVNWTNTGAVFQKRPDWATGNFWAPEIAHFKGTYFIYYVGRKKNGLLSIAVATAQKPQGPYTDHGPIMSQEAGSIDALPVEDETGKRYLIWKEDGNSQNQPTPLWIQELSEDGTQLVGEMSEIMRNDAPWEGRVIEGPAVIRHDGYYFFFYAGNACCGRNCHYGTGVARAKNLLGPWEKNPKNPIILDNEIWKCPGHGTVVQDPRGDFYLMYHAYHADDFVYVGRQAVLDKIEFDADGWPSVNRTKGTSFSASAPAGVSATHLQFNFRDEFAKAELDRARLQNRKWRVDPPPE